MAENFIKSAVPASRKGVFRKKAQAAGKSTSEFAREHEHDSGKLGNEARLAETLMKMRYKRRGEK